MTKPPKLIAGVARITAPRAPTKRQRLRQQREAAAWQRAQLSPNPNTWKGTAQ
jgi:hypothetical protein